MSSQKSIRAFASQLFLRGAGCAAECLRRLLFRLREHGSKTVDQRLRSNDRGLFGRRTLITRVAEDHVRKSAERRRHLAAGDFRHRLAELGRLRGELGVHRKDDIDRTFDRLLEVLASDLQRTARWYAVRDDD